MSDQGLEFKISVKAWIYDDAYAKLLHVVKFIDAMRISDFKCRNVIEDTKPPIFVFYLKDDSIPFTQEQKEMMVKKIDLMNVEPLS